MPHQYVVLNDTKQYSSVAYYLDMGLGKTYVGAEKMIQIGNTVNLVICQKSKVDDWVQHFRSNYATHDRDYCTKELILDLTNKKQFEYFMSESKRATEEHCIVDDWTGQSYRQENLYPFMIVGIINYELAWHRPQLLQLHDFTLMLDESSLIQNEKAKQTKFIMKMKPSNVILLSGTPTSGKYENLWTQAQLLGWVISKDRYDSTYINWKLTEDDGSGFRHKIVDMSDPYKNVERLKAKLREHGAVFLKTEDVLDLPEQNFIEVMVDAPKTYKKFMKDDYIKLFQCNWSSGWEGKKKPVDMCGEFIELIGDTIFTKRLYARQLCSQFNQHKIDALTDLIQSTSDRLIIFYNFNDELDILKGICEALERPYSQVNGSIKDLLAYEEFDDSISIIQYQAGAMGLNLQKCNKIIYFSLPERSELFEQSKKRIHRIGQSQSCFYYVMMTKDTIEGTIYENLKMRRDYTDDLFIYEQST